MLMLCLFETRMANSDGSVFLFCHVQPGRLSLWMVWCYQPSFWQMGGQQQILAHFSSNGLTSKRLQEKRSNRPNQRLCHNFWTNWDLDPVSTSKWPSEHQFCERWKHSCQKNDQKWSKNWGGRVGAVTNRRQSSRLFYCSLFGWHPENGLATAKHPENQPSRLYVDSTNKFSLT